MFKSNLYVVAVIIFIGIILCLWLIFARNGNANKMIGGSRADIFSRFHYMPDFVYLSKFGKYDKCDHKMIANKPYEFCHMNDASWLQPWTFPART